MTNPLHLIFVRHGETNWNIEGRIQGCTDIPLNENGRAQLRAVARRFESDTFDAIYSSDLSRAYDTARAIAEPHGMSVQLDERLRECNFGKWEGHSAADLHKTDPNGWARRWDDATYAPPGGESTYDFLARSAHLMRDVKAAHPDGGRLLLVSHGGSIRMFLMALLDLPVHAGRSFFVGNTSVSELVVYPERVRLALWNDMSHLRENSG